MTERLNKIASVGAVLILVALTLGTFYLLRDYGPESAIRRFHEAALSNDDNALRRLTAAEEHFGATAQLKQRVRAYSEAGASIRLAKVIRSPRRAEAEVDYIFPHGIDSIVWVVDKKDNSRWLIDPDATLAPVVP